MNQPLATINIRYCKREELDLRKWDACVSGAGNRLIYGFGFYLDAMTGGQWDALVHGDYEAVMPLTWRRKAGIRYLYQPAFTQQTGIFSEHSVPPVLVENFLTELRTRFRFAEIFLNYDNPLSTLEPRTNFILSLNRSYERILDGYKKNLTRNLQTLAGEGLIYVKDFPLQSALDAYQQEYQDRPFKIRAEEYARFGKLCHGLQNQNQVIVRAVTNTSGDLLAAAVILKDASRLYLIQPTTLASGRDKLANHYLLDQLIREWSGQDVLLDFEGSDQPGIARFCQNFGSVDQPYFFYRHNGLPWPWRLFKK